MHSPASGSWKKTIFQQNGDLSHYSNRSTTTWTTRVEQTGLERVEQVHAQHALPILPFQFHFLGSYQIREEFYTNVLHVRANAEYGPRYV